MRDAEAAWRTDRLAGLVPSCRPHSSPSPAGAGRIQAATICPRSAARTGLRPAPGRVFVQMFTPAAVQRPTRAVSAVRRLCRTTHGDPSAGEGGDARFA